MRTFVMAGLTAALAAAPLAAQTLQVRGQRPLTFGVVLPGVPRVVLRTDPANSGEYDIRYRRFSVLLLQFTLPTSLTGPGGATMPLSFGTDDAGFAPGGAIGSQIGFDPNAGGVGVLPNNGRASVFLGGTAQPLTGQAPGAYTGTVVLTVTVL
jgi:hypothetical protein